MKTKEEFERAVLPDAFIGGCPKCGRWDENLKVGRAYWWVCYKHRTKHFWGEVLASRCREQCPGGWGANAIMLEEFAEVRPAYPAIPHDVAAALSRLTREMPGEETVREDAVGDRTGAKARSEAAGIVRGWLYTRRRAWVQFVEPSGDEPADGEADRV